MNEQDDNNRDLVSSSGNNSDEQVEPEAQVALEKLERERPEQLTEIMTMMAGVGPVANPLHKKMTEEHISSVLQLAADHDERQNNLHKSGQTQGADDRKANRRYGFAVFAIVVLVFIAVLYLFKDQSDILIPTITGLGGLVGGFLGGWGYGNRRSD